MARERLVYALLLRGTAGIRAADRSTSPTRETRSCGIAVLWGECGHPTTPVPIVNLIRWRGRPNWAMFCPMLDGCRLIWSLLFGLFRSRATLEAENLVLRQQIIVLRRTAPKRLTLSGFDRLIFVTLYQLFPDVRSALSIVSPETVVRWHRADFRAYWRWKSRRRWGRPKVPLEIRQLIREMSLPNPLWGAPRIYRELLKLGIDIGQTMARRRRPPSQGWRTFLRLPDSFDTSTRARARSRLFLAVCDNSCSAMGKGGSY